MSLHHFHSQHTMKSTQSMRSMQNKILVTKREHL
jgi:hypothetical protein